MVDANESLDAPMLNANGAHGRCASGARHHVLCASSAAAPPVRCIDRIVGVPFAVIVTVLTDTALTARGRRLQVECGRLEYDRPGRSAARANRSTLARSRLPWRAATEAARVAGAANRAARPPATCGGRTAAHAPHRGKNDAAPHPVRSARRAWPLADRAYITYARDGARFR